MQILEIIWLLVAGGLIVACGIFQIISGKFLAVSHSEYTKDSLRKFARVSGVLYVIFGILVACVSLCVGTLHPILIGVIVGSGAVLMVAYIILSESILKKREIL